jgi:hypothetical protein
MNPLDPESDGFGSSDLVRNAIQVRVTEAFPSIAASLIDPLLSIFQTSRSACGGDLDKFLVILVIAIRTASHPRFAAMTPEQLLHEDLLILPGLGTNARSIAASLQMPRETVRRKVAELVEVGWAARRNSHLYATAEGYRQLAPIRVCLERLTVENYITVKKLLDSTASTTGSGQGI